MRLRNLAHGFDTILSRSGPAAFFDEYVRRIFPERRAASGADWRWPGDEWADAELQARTAAWLTEAAGQARRMVEFGPGAGKYTAVMLAREDVELTAFEISPAFVEVLEARFPQQVRDGRLGVRRIDFTDNSTLWRQMRASGPVDFVFAVDVLMMMDWQSALVYLLSSALSLRPGGRFAASFADAGSSSGWARMIRDLGRHSAFDDTCCTRFHWVDAAMVRTALTRFGFGDVRILHGPDDGLDIARLYVTAELVAPETAGALAPALLPAGDSTNRADDA